MAPGANGMEAHLAHEDSVRRLEAGEVEMGVNTEIIHNLAFATAGASSGFGVVDHPHFVAGPQDGDHFVDNEKGMKGEEEIDDPSPVEEVRLTVPTTDDPTMVYYTWRMWIIGFIVCSVLSFVNQFFYYRAQPILVTAITGQIVSLYAGRLMHRTLPNWTFLWMPLNPGPFNIKEHVLITIFANAGYGFGYGNAWGIDLLTIIKTFYKLPLNFWVGMVIITCPQLLGYGWAGLMRKYVVEPASMWWPQNLVNVSVFRTLHENEPKVGITRIRFFFLVVLGSFLYYWVPDYLFTTITCLSWVCWVWPNSVYAHQIGSGFSGLGLGAFSFDWATITSFNGSPLVAPFFAILNTFIGFALYLWIFIPILYYNNAYNARRFPLYTKDLFNYDGTSYNIQAVVTSKDSLDVNKYQANGELYLPLIYIFAYGTEFASLMATLVHVALFHGTEIRACWSNKNAVDVHGRLMRKYPPLSNWWFVGITVIAMALSIGICEAIKDTMQIPWWGLFVVTGIAIIISLPLTVIVATTNFLTGLSFVCQLLGGFLFPGKPIANMVTNVWIYGTVAQAIAFLQDFKLGHYMKIPPRAMFAVQVIGTLYAAIINYAVAWWQLETIKNICQVPQGGTSQWTCPYDNVVYANTIVWGLLGPQRVINPRYSIVYYFFLIGAVAPIPCWLAIKYVKKLRWMNEISTPLLFNAMSHLPTSGAINNIPWFFVGTFFQYFVFNYRKKWWARYNYVLSAGMDTGVAFSGILIFFALQNQNNYITWWGNNYDRCFLASCPVEAGALSDNSLCPVFT